MLLAATGMITDVTPLALFFALLGGILPAVFWVWFWLKEDKLHPEPRGLIILAFLMGMFATACAYPIEKFIAENITGTLQLLFLWSFTEEVLKLLAMWTVLFHSKYFDEPIDAVVYFITIALGFASVENALFLFNPIGEGDAVATILLGNLRFVGATLLHVAASGIVGVALALAYYGSKRARRLAMYGGLAGAIALHTVFNFSIIMSEGAYLYEVFIALWTLILGLLLVCEKIKRMAPRSHVDYPHTGLMHRKNFSI